MTDTTTPPVAGIYERFFRLLDERGISQREAARDLGYSPSVITSYKAGTYTGDVPEIERRIVDYLARIAERDRVLDIPPVDLPTNRNVAKACRITHAQRTIGLVIGPAGVGKTYALRSYVKAVPAAIMIEVDQSYTLHALAHNVARSVGTSTEGSVAAITERIVAKLQGSDLHFIFDEADYLSAKALEWVRRVIHDKGRCSVTLSGLAELEYQLQGAKNVHDQLRTRIGVLYRVPRPGTEEIALIARAAWPQLAQDAIEVLTREAGRCLRTAVNLMAGAHVVAAEQSPPETIPTVDSFLAAAELLP